MKTYDNLGAKHQTAIDLKLEGFKYKEIAGQLQVKEQTVAEWFQTKGICYKAFQQKKQERAKERRTRFSEVDEHLQEMACDAVRAIKENLARNNLKAALGVLDRVGFQPIQRFQPMGEPKVNITTYVYSENEVVKENTPLQPYYPTEDSQTTTLEPYIGNMDELLD